MPNRCAAVNCRPKGDVNLTYHRFPLNNKELLNLWLQRISRKDFIPNKHSVLCSIHFYESDFEFTRKDTNRWRKLKRSQRLKKRYLKDGAVPTKFPNLPRYFSKTAPTPRSGLSTSSSRHHRDVLMMEEQSQRFINEDKLSSFEELLSKIHKETISSDFIIFENDLGLNMVIIRSNLPYRITASLTIDRSLSIQIYHHEKHIPTNSYDHIMQKQTRISLLSQAVNLMAFIKSLDDSSEVVNHKVVAIECLDTYIEDGVDNPEEILMVSFLKEQLELSCVSKHGRRYSPELILMSYILYASSSSAYQHLLDQKVLCLPSVLTLRKITRRTSSQTGLDNAEYLKMRLSKLNHFETHVSLIMDEIYLGKRVEYSGGKIYGLVEDKEDVAQTALVFMIKSLSSKYQDVAGKKKYSICYILFYMHANQKVYSIINPIVITL